jgi:hypothetical protein
MQEGLDEDVQQRRVHGLLRYQADLGDGDLPGTVQHSQQGTARAFQFIGRSSIRHADFGQHLNHAGRQANNAAVLRELDAARQPLAKTPA